MKHLLPIAFALLCSSAWIAAQSGAPYSEIAPGLVIAEKKVIDGQSCGAFYFHVADSSKSELEKANFRLKTATGEVIHLRSEQLEKPLESAGAMFTHILWIPSDAGKFKNAALLHDLPAESVTLEWSARFPELGAAEALKINSLLGDVVNTRQIFGDDSETYLAELKAADFISTCQLYAASEVMAKSAMEGLQKKQGPDHEETVKAVSLVALSLKALGRHAEAKSYFLRLMETGERQFGPTHPQTLLQAVGVGSCLLDEEKPDEAEPYFRRALSAADAKTPMGYNVQIAADLALSKLNHDRNDLHAALAHGRAAATTAERKLGADHRYTLQAKSQMAVALLDMGKHLEAAALARQIIAHYDARPDSESSLYETAKDILAKTLRFSEERGKNEGKK